MAATAIVGTGTVIEHSKWTGKVISIDGPSPTLETINASSLATENAHDWIGTSLIESGNISCEIEIVDSDLTSGVPTVSNLASELKITFPGGASSSRFECSAMCVGYTAAFPLEDKIAGTVDFKCTGPWTSVPAS